MKPTHLSYLIGNYYSLYTENGLDKNIYKVLDIEYVMSGLGIRIQAEDVLTEERGVFKGEDFYPYVHNKRTYKDVMTFIKHYKERTHETSYP